MRWNNEGSKRLDVSDLKATYLRTRVRFILVSCFPGLPICNDPTRKNSNMVNITSKSGYGSFTYSAAKLCSNLSVTIKYFHPLGLSVPIIGEMRPDFNLTVKIQIWLGIINTIIIIVIYSIVLIFIVFCEFLLLIHSLINTVIKCQI